MQDLYEVEAKEEIRRIGKGGEIETWYRIWATSKGGTYFHVDISEEDIGTDKVAAALAKRAKELDAI